MFVESKVKGVQRPVYEEKCHRDGKMSTVYMIADVSRVVVFTFENKTSKPSFNIRMYICIGNMTLGQSSAVLVVDCGIHLEIFSWRI